MILDKKEVEAQRIQKIKLNIKSPLINFLPTWLYFTVPSGAHRTCATPHQTPSLSFQVIPSSTVPLTAAELLRTERSLKTADLDTEYPRSYPSSQFQFQSHSSS